MARRTFDVIDVTEVLMHSTSLPSGVRKEYSLLECAVDGDHE